MSWREGCFRVESFYTKTFLLDWGKIRIIIKLTSLILRYRTTWFLEIAIEFSFFKGMNTLVLK